MLPELRVMGNDHRSDLYPMPLDMGFFLNADLTSPFVCHLAPLPVSGRNV